MKTDAFSIHDHIRLEAFLLSEKAGHPAGMDATFWMQAEAIVHGRTAVVAGAGKALKVKAKTGTTAKPTKKPTSTQAVARVARKKAPLPPKNAALPKAKAKPTGKRAK